MSKVVRVGLIGASAGGGRARESLFRMEAVGERGTLQLDGGAARGLQSGRLRLPLDSLAQPVDEGELAGLRDEIGTGSVTAAGFDHAVRLTRLVEGDRVPKGGVASGGAIPVTGSGRDSQATRVGRLTVSLSPIGAMLSSVM